jgi:hypothetical protein
MGYGMTEMEVVIHVLNNLPKEYESVVEGIEGDLDNGNHVDLEKVKSKLRAKFARMKNHLTPPRNQQRNNEMATPNQRFPRVNDAALYASQEGFKGNCRKCGEYGHKFAHCPQKEEEMKCTYCKFKGHTVEFCRRKKKDEEEQGQMEVLMAIETPCGDLTVEKEMILGEDGLALMSEEEEQPGQVWIGDSGASCHMTNSEEGMFNFRSIKQGIKMADGTILEATKCGDIVMTNKDPASGKEVCFELKGVKYVPGLCKKLFSIKTALKRGASLGSIGESMIVKKGNVELTFREIPGSKLLSTVFKPKMEQCLSSQEVEKEIWTEKRENVENFVEETKDFFSGRVKDVPTLKRFVVEEGFWTEKKEIEEPLNDEDQNFFGPSFLDKSPFFDGSKRKQTVKVGQTTEATHVDSVGTNFSFFNKTGKHKSIWNMIMADIGEMFSVPFMMNMVDLFMENLDSKHFAELQQKINVHPRHIKGRVLKSGFGLEEEKYFTCE